MTRLSSAIVLSFLVAACPRPPPAEPCDLIECSPDEVEVQIGDRCECQPARAGDGDGDADTDVEADAEVGCELDGVCNADCSWDVDCVEGCPPEGLPYGGECDPVAQTCCPPGQRCIYTEGPATVGELCVDVVGNGGQNDPCYTYGEDECGPGLSCYPFDFVELCLTFCESQEDCPVDGSYRCERGGTTHYSVCFPGPADCNPVEGNGCGEGETCVLYVPRTGEGYTMCVAEGERGLGEYCGDQHGCTRGLGCHQPHGGGGSQCEEYCELAAPSCSAGACTDQRHALYGICDRD